jgi:hypothetical protein
MVDRANAPPDTSSEAQAWRDNAEKLAAYAFDHLVNRTDIYGRHEADGGRYMAKDGLTHENLLRHFRGEAAVDILGLFPIAAEEIEGPDGEMIVSSTCKWTTNDIDYHGDGVAPEFNLKAAKGWCRRAVNLGFRPLLLESNGNGGYRVFIIFSEPIKSTLAFHFIRWLQRDWKDLGFAKEPEAFPKQDQLGLLIKHPVQPWENCGSWVRLFGRHHKRDHYTRFWNGERWLAGQDAIDFLLDHTGDDLALIPAEVHDLVKQDRPSQGRAPAAIGPRGFDDLSLAAEALRFVAPMANDYDSWLQVGMSLRSLGPQGLGLWDSWSKGSLNGNYEPGACAAKWDTFSPAEEVGPRAISLGSLFHWATAAGWVRPEKRSPASVPSPFAVPPPVAPARGSFKNFCKQTGSDGKEAKRALSAPELVASLDELAKGWPKRVGETLFIEAKDHRPVYLGSPPQFFGWVDGIASVCWADGQSMITQARFYEHMRKFAAERFDAIETFPHYPPLPATYYMHPPVKPKRGGPLLDQLIGFFSPAGGVDKELIRAAIMTLFWGGPPGQRPAFRIDGPEDDPPELGKRGTGKTTLVEILASLVGGLVDLEENEDIAPLKTRLLSSEEGRKRILRIDNVKTLRLSWSALEKFISSKVISGKALYHGEGQRPNTMTVFITINGGAFSKDMAQRSISIRLARPQYAPGWHGSVTRFIEENRWELTAEILGTLADEQGGITPVTRWAAWEREVLGQCSGYDECQEAIRERAQAMDDDDADAYELEAFFERQLNDRGLHPDGENIRIPTAMAGEWLSLYEKRDIKACTATTMMLAKPLTRLKHKRTKEGRFWLWAGNPNGPDKDPLDIEGKRVRATKDGGG